MSNKQYQAGFLIILVAVAYATLAFVIFPSIAQPAPDRVVHNFFTWYIEYAQQSNPLVDKAYRSSNALSPEFVARLDEFTSGQMMFDPILCAQDVPERITTAAPVISGSSATVKVETSFASHSFDVRLAREGSSWKIADVVCSGG
ncbi:MAG: DUF3828 domain-containing protein [Caldilinea sp.]|jgi:hypothetical protein